MIALYPVVHVHPRLSPPLGEPLGVLLYRHVRAAVRARRRRKIIALAENVRSYARARGGFTASQARGLACAA